MDKSALHRFFLNECSPAERKEVLSWLLNPQNDLLIKTWMKENWDLVPLTGADNSSVDLDVQKIWNDLSKKLFTRDSDGIVNQSKLDPSFEELDLNVTSKHIDLTGDRFDVDAEVEHIDLDAPYPGLGSDMPRTFNIEAPVRNLSTRRSKSWWFAVAASVIVMLGFFAYAYRESILYIRYQTAFAEVSEFKLPDGSRVVLNANSSLLVPRWGFNNGDRKVELQGEAAFDVIHTINHKKFLVATNSQLNVEVLGTEFLLYSRNNTNKVILKKGSVKVQFNDEQRQPVLMKPGDVVTADRAGSLSVKHQQPISNSIPWKEHRFQFDSTTLAEAVIQISDFFGDIIVINDETLGNKTLSGSYSAATARELLTILSEIYNLEIEQTNAKIILRKRTLVMLDR